MTIYTYGSSNPTASGVPGLSINVQPPPAVSLSGAPSNILAIVGTASWGPVGSPVAFSDEDGGAIAFGPMKARKYDMMTQVHAAVMQGASNMRGVRVTDGTDTAATGTIQTNGLTVTAKYTGTRGALIQVSIGTGTKTGTYKATVTMPGIQPEIFDNLAEGLTANAIWVAIASAINSGTANAKASQLIVATAGASTTAPSSTTTTTSLTGGTDGVTTITSTVLLGSDTSPRKGMYALRNTGAAIVVLADCDDNTSWAAQIAFAKSEVCLPVVVSPSGDTISNFTTLMSGIDDPYIKVLFGDWVYMTDSTNSIPSRLVSPQGFWAGRKIAGGPHQSALNKALNGVIGTQKSATKTVYATAELQLIGQARGDVLVMNPPGGDYPAFAFGRTASSDASRRQETYTTMTNYLARSLDQAGGLGRFVGELATPEETREAEGVIGGFLQAEWDAGRIGNANGTIPYSVTVTNPSLGVQKANVKVQYLSVIEYFIVDLTGGSSVEIVAQQQAA